MKRQRFLMLTHLFHDLGRLCINIIENRITGPPIYNEDCSVSRQRRDDWLSVMHEEEEMRSDKLVDGWRDAIPSNAASRRGQRNSRLTR
jgi:hypothetical protein